MTGLTIFYQTGAQNDKTRKPVLKSAIFLKKINRIQEMGSPLEGKKFLMNMDCFLVADSETGATSIIVPEQVVQCPIEQFMATPAPQKETENKGEPFYEANTTAQPISKIVSLTNNLKP